jgi:UDP-glucose 4-epimerase
METVQKKVLVTGGAGYIGSAIVQELLQAGNTVVIFDDLSTGREDKVAPHTTFVQGDVTDIETLRSVFKAHAFDAVIHCAAKKVMHESETNPGKYFFNNVGGTLNVLMCMEEFNVPKIIFSSTAAVYAPIDEHRPVTENDVVDPKSVYGRSKLMAEMLISEFGRLQKIRSYTIFRYFNVAGDAGLMYEEPQAEAVFPVLAKAIKHERTFTMYGTDYMTRDGSAVRDYIHVSDLSSAHICALNSDASGIYNLGTSEGCTVKELIAAFEKRSEKKVNVVPQTPRPGELALMLADASKARTELGWTPVKTLNDMVDSTAKLFDL